MEGVSGIGLYLKNKTVRMPKRNASLAFVLVLISTITFAQAPQRAKCLEKFNPSVPKKPGLHAAAKTSSISKPMRSANYAWNVNLSQWLYTDSSEYAYTPVGWLSSELKKTSAPTTRSTYTYDNQNRLTNKLTETWNAITSQWMNTSREIFLYNPQGDLILESYETFNGVIWVVQAAGQYIYAYDANNHLVDYISQIWNSSTQVWNDFRHQYGFAYDANGNCTQYEEQAMIGSNWVNMDRYQYSYVNNEPVDVLTQHWNGNSYVNDERMVNITWHAWDDIFSSQTAVSSCTIQNWVSNSWLPWDRVTVTYDNYGGSVEIDQSYNGSTWDNTYRIKVNYDNQYNYTGNSLELWNAPVWDLYSEDKIINTYDTDFNLSQQIWQSWDDFASQMVNLEKRVYVGHQVFAGLGEQEGGTLIRVYPNPCNDYLEIRPEQSSLLSAEAIELQVYDVNGQLVRQKTMGLGDTRLSMDGLNPGLYLYTIQVGHTRVTGGKLVRQ